MTNLPYPVLIYPDPSGGYVAEVPQLKGCLAQGETESECLEELHEVARIWLESNAGQSVPTPDTEHFIERLRQAVNS